MNEEIITLQESIEQAKDIRESKLYRIPKRIIDIMAGIVGVILLIPITIIVKICYICQHDNNPIFFKQERIGKNGKPIYIYKFRSMVPNADQVLFDMLEKDEEMRREYKRYKKLKNDPRITKVGKFIRNTSIDEIPQFLNLLKGDMSLVGPRPYLFREKEDMGEYYDTIIKCKPGITGYWQVNGRSNTDFGKRLVLDEYYYYHRNLNLDARIVGKTFAQVVMKKDVM